MKYKDLTLKIWEQKLNFRLVTMSQKMCHNVTLKVMLLIKNSQQYSLSNALKWFSYMSLLIEHTLLISNVT